MENLIKGIHHVTALAGNAQENIEFYTGILGLRLVKKTINFDAPGVYHFYYGDETGNPGSILTFFPYGDFPKGRHGKGMLNTTSFSVPASSITYWTERLKKFGIKYKEPQERFEKETVLYFEDRDGLGLELVFSDDDERPGYTGGPVLSEHSIKGFYNVEIWEEGYERTAGLLTEHLDHKLIAEKGNRFRFAATHSPGNFVDILCAPDSLKGLAGNGTVHHIAFNTPTAETQTEVRERLMKNKVNPTPVLDRSYFTSIYFREPGGVLFEVATSGPGFMADESKEDLGKNLKMPDQYEKHRTEIEKSLPPVYLHPEKYS